MHCSNVLTHVLPEELFWARSVTRFGAAPGHVTVLLQSLPTLDPARYAHRSGGKPGEMPPEYPEATPEREERE
jgi:hypothetical protein